MLNYYSIICHLDWVSTFWQEQHFGAYSPCCTHKSIHLYSKRNTHSLRCWYIRWEWRRGLRKYRCNKIKMGIYFHIVKHTICHYTPIKVFGRLSTKQIHSEFHNITTRALPHSLTRELSSLDSIKTPSTALSITCIIQYT